MSGTERSAAPFLGAIATSVVVGVVVAIALLSGGSAPELQATPAPPAKPCDEAGITPESGRSGTCMANDTLLTVAVGREPLVLPDRTVRVLSTELVEATTFEGQARDRARLEVRLQVENTSSKPIVANPDGEGIYLAVAGRTIRADANADELGDALSRDRTIAARQRTEGTLRFELEGVVTQTLRETGRADLGVAGSDDNRKGVIRLRVSSPE